MKPIKPSKTKQTDTVQATIVTTAGRILPTADIHIDRIRITAPCTHRPTGKIMYSDDEELGWIPSGATANQKTLKDGGEKAYIRSKDIDKHGRAYFLEIHCCPPLVLQKHNLFGHGSLQDYVYAILDLATKRLGINVDPYDRLEWRRGCVSITEIHLTGNFACPRSAILPIIQAIDDNNTCRKTRKIPTCISLDGGKTRRSTYHALTIYDKMLESINRWKKRGEYQSKLTEEVHNAIRAEVKLYSQEIKSLKLGYVSRWKDVDVAELFFRFFNKYDIQYSIQRLLTEDELACLTRAERNAYTLWLKGVDIKDQGCRTTAWKYAKSISEKTGLNIKGNRRPEALPDIDMREIFAPGNVLPVPAWAIGTPYYFAPATPLAPTMFERALRSIPGADETEDHFPDADGESGA